MLTRALPKLPMRDAAATRTYYVGQLGFRVAADYGDYLLMARDEVELHFFLFRGLDPLTNYGQVYLVCRDVDALHGQLRDAGVSIHPNAPLADRPWGMREFALLDPDRNLLTFGQPRGGDVGA